MACGCKKNRSTGRAVRTNFPRQTSFLVRRGREVDSEFTDLLQAKARQRELGDGWTVVTKKAWK